MNSNTTQRLMDINRQFYADFGAPFSATRQRLQPGVHQILSQLNGAESILDIGCGNGEFARALANKGFGGTYTGLDFSLPLLSAASSQSEGFSAIFQQADLTAPDWDLSLYPAHFSLITAFAVLHHIPDINLRLRILQKVRCLLAPGGKFILSNWQFLNSEKLKNRVQPWQAAGLTSLDVDENDYLLDWRGGGSGLRYVHHFSVQELAQLASSAGFKIKESYFSDGDGGRLSLYQVWENDENKG